MGKDADPVHRIIENKQKRNIGKANANPTVVEMENGNAEASGQTQPVSKKIQTTIRSSVDSYTKTSALARCRIRPHAEP